jgi:hypothetical protein
MEYLLLSFAVASLPIFERFLSFVLRPDGVMATARSPAFCYFLLLPPKESNQRKVTARIKFAKNLRHSLNFGNSSLRSSDSPKFLTLVPPSAE